MKTVNFRNLADKHGYRRWLYRHKFDEIKCVCFFVSEKALKLFHDFQSSKTQTFICKTFRSILLYFVGAFKIYNECICVRLYTRIVTWMKACKSHLPHQNVKMLTQKAMNTINMELRCCNSIFQNWKVFFHNVVRIWDVVGTCITSIIIIDLMKYINIVCRMCDHLMSANK